VHDRHRRAGEQRALLEAVDIVVTVLVEHAQVRREAAQRSAMHHQAEARGLRRRHRVEVEVGHHRVEDIGADRLAALVVAGRRWPLRHAFDPAAHLLTRDRVGQRGDAVHRVVLVEHTVVLRGDGRGVQHDLVRRLQARHPEAGLQHGGLDAGHTGVARQRRDQRFLGEGRGRQ
jgi:hypothetical protein